MAWDLALLAQSSLVSTASLRAYTWENPEAVTIGKYQPTALISSTTRDWARRPTGGGLVDHTDDSLTWSLIIPNSLIPITGPGVKWVYAILQDAMRQTIETSLRFKTDQVKTSPSSRPEICFREPRVEDLINERRQKISGMALYRNRSGILVQGSLQHLPYRMDTDAFLRKFAQQIFKTKSLRSPVITTLICNDAYQSELQKVLLAAQIE